MSKRSETTVLTVLCMVYDGTKLLLQDRIKEDWKGMTFPGGHVEKGESFVKAVIRETKEETGLLIHNPKICGIKQFQTRDNERYVVFLFKTNEYEGELCSSEEGKMRWIERSELINCNLVDDFMELLRVFDEENLNEFMYIHEENKANSCVKLF
jgi:8-oxo-dGTP diphosphatase